MGLKAASPDKSFLLASSGAAVASTNVTTEETAATIAVPANTLGLNGVLRITALFTVTNGANDKTLRIKFGGTTFSTLLVTTVAAVRMECVINNRNAANAQVAFTNGGIGSSGSAVTTGTVDSASAQNITITTQKEVGTEVATLESYSVEVMRN